MYKCIKALGLSFFFTNDNKVQLLNQNIGVVDFDERKIFIPCPELKNPTIEQEKKETILGPHYEYNKEQIFVYETNFINPQALSYIGFVKSFILFCFLIFGLKNRKTVLVLSLLLICKFVNFSICFPVVFIFFMLLNLCFMFLLNLEIMHLYHKKWKEWITITKDFQFYFFPTGIFVILLSFIFQYMKFFFIKRALKNHENKPAKSKIDLNSSFLDYLFFFPINIGQFFSKKIYFAHDFKDCFIFFLQEVGVLFILTNQNVQIFFFQQPTVIRQLQQNY